MGFSEFKAWRDMSKVLMRCNNARTWELNCYRWQTTTTANGRQREILIFYLMTSPIGASPAGHFFGGGRKGAFWKKRWNALRATDFREKRNPPQADSMYIHSYLFIYIINKRLREYKYHHGDAFCRILLHHYDIFAPPPAVTSSRWTVRGLCQRIILNYVNWLRKN